MILDTTEVGFRWSAAHALDAPPLYQEKKEEEPKLGGCLHYAWRLDAFKHKGNWKRDPLSFLSIHRLGPRCLQDTFNRAS